MPRFWMALVAAVGLTASAAAQTNTWKIDPAHSAAQFSVRHLGISTVRVAFVKLSGSAQFDPSDPTKGALEATIDALSVDTRVEMRDKDLRSPNFLDAEKYPTLTLNRSGWRQPAWAS
jgi:polyisoprenoid-binding protein YceI